MLMAVMLCWHLPSLHAKQQETHNPLEKVNVHAASIQMDNSIKMAVSTAKLTKGRGEWVEVSICRHLHRIACVYTTVTSCPDLYFWYIELSVYTPLEASMLQTKCASPTCNNCKQCHW